MAIRLLLLSCGVIALGTLITAAQEYARGEFGPVYTVLPFPMHKNFVGPLLAMAAVIVYLRPAWLGWRTRLSWMLLVLFLAGVIVTQSRQAMLGLVVVFFLVVVRRRVDRRRSRFVLVIVAAAIFVVSVMVQDQLQSGNRFNSTLQRLDWFNESIQVWLTDPWLGVGLRWWYTSRFDAQFQPPNAELEVLTSAGVVGLVAFLAMFAGSMVVLRRLDPVYGLMPLMVLVCRLAQAQFDLFWVAVSGSLPWLITGIALGVHARVADGDREDRRLAAAKATHVRGSLRTSICTENKTKYT